MAGGERETMGVEASGRKEGREGDDKSAKASKSEKAATEGEAKGANIKQLLLIALSIHIMPVISPISLSALKASG